MMNCFTYNRIALLYLQSRTVSYYITTPIFYANASPHLGHVHTLLLADAMNIHQRLKLKSDDTIFSTGMDEHGIKIQNAAQRLDLDCQEFCDKNVRKFALLFDEYKTTKTHFIRTTQQSHQDVVRTVWNQLHDRGFIYKSKYSGWYCTTDEAFIPESQICTKNIGSRDVKVDQNGNEVDWVEEENYMFALQSLEDKVVQWLERNEPVVPKKFNDEAIRMLKQGPIGDISISRPARRLGWGIRVPSDSTQTIYVWLDALTNYLTVGGYKCESSDLVRWPIDCQVIGKDILKFHAIYWPAFLMALELDLPKKLLCHSHWLVDSVKMSKSRGNVVNPFEENRLLTPEGIRYFLLRASTTHSDTNYNRLRAINTINAELADTYGNLLSRSCSKAINKDQVIPTTHSDRIDQSMVEIKERLVIAKSNCDKFYESADFYKGVDEIMQILRLNQKLYEKSEPWNLVKSSEDKARQRFLDLQAITFETLRICSILLQPIIPKISNIALDRLNIRGRDWDDAILNLGSGESKMRSLSITGASTLFKRIKPDEL